MNKKLVATAVAVLLALTLAGGALAAGPNSVEGQGFGIGRAMGNLVTRVADFLNRDVEEVRQERVDGATLADILGDKVDEFIQATITARQTMLDQMLAEGKITAEQHELCSNFSTEKLEERLNTVVVSQNGNAMHARGRLHRHGK